MWIQIRTDHYYGRPPGLDPHGGCWMRIQKQEAKIDEIGRKKTCWKLKLNFFLFKIIFSKLILWKIHYSNKKSNISGVNLESTGIQKILSGLPILYSQDPDPNYNVCGSTSLISTVYYTVMYGKSLLHSYLRARKLGFPPEFASGLACTHVTVYTTIFCFLCT